MFWGPAVIAAAAVARDTSRPVSRISMSLPEELLCELDAMVVERVAKPSPRPTDVLVRVRACGVVPNLLNVLMHWQGWFPELPLPKLPAIFGLDVAGEIEAVGELVQNFHAGDRVYAEIAGEQAAFALAKRPHSRHSLDAAFLS